ncbi:MAG TPA: sulfatase [Candidatus Binatia bacterium]|nr:sulfatase [Candidatus Binatia bacterium]
MADDVARAMGRQTPRETVGDVSRAALPGTYAEVLRHPENPGSVEIGEASDGIESSFRCPARLAGRPAFVAVGQLLAKTPGVDLLTERVGCPPAADTPVRLVLPTTIALDKAIWIMRGLETDRTETGTIPIPRGARLQVALGLSPALPGQPATPARFRVVAHGTQGRSATVLERRLDPGATPTDAGWVRVEADLDAARDAVGPEAHFTFEAEAEDAGPVPTFPVWGDPTLTWPRAQKDVAAVRRNLVLVSIDTLRADRLGAYGAHRDTSPRLDALATESTLFETVVSPAPWTLPSHASMMTGLYGCAHGIVGPGLGKAFPDGVVPLAEHLRDAGYTTAAFTEDGFVDPVSFARGFGSYWENRDGSDRVPATVAHAAAWLRDEATEPFLLFFHTYQSHDPYFSPPEYERMLSTADGASHPASATPHGQELLKYDAAVRYTDTAIAPLLDAVRSGPRGRTLLVVTSDHGEAFGEHGTVGHGAELYEEVLRVPLFVWGPGLVAPGRRVPGLVGVVDVTPTILDLLGFPVPTGISGVSLAPQVRAGSTVLPVTDRILFSENSLHDRYRLAARWPRWKAVWDTPGPQTFDLDRDPGELQPVTSADLTDQATAARARFEQECARQQAEIAAAGSRQEQPGALPDPERQRWLKELGYVE